MSNKEVMQQALQALASYSVGERLNASQVNDLIAQLEAALAQPVQEPVAWMLASAIDDFKRGYLVEVSRDQEESDDIPLYKHPPTAQRPWVGLTEKERNDLEDYCQMTIGKFAFDAIEAILKERNNG
jgi:hypothetical protein